MFGLGMTELIVIGIILLILFGNENLPQTIRKLTKGLGEVKKVTNEAQRSWSQVREDMSQAVRDLEFQEELKKITEDVKDLEENIKEGIENEVKNAGEDSSSSSNKKNKLSDGSDSHHDPHHDDEGHHHEYAHQEHEENVDGHEHADDKGGDYDDGSEFDADAYAKKQEEISKKIAENMEKAKERASAEKVEAQTQESVLPVIKPPEGQVAARGSQESPTATETQEEKSSGEVPETAKQEEPAKSSSNS